MQMGSEIEIVEQRLKSFTGQLQTESGILERLVYKHKNQHRRCSYFQYILKVRRDLKLLKLANLDEILEASFLVINGNRPKQKVQLLESLKRRRCSGGKYNFLEKLLGVTRLLSQMVEPLLKAAMEISQLLARSFFMKFSLTVLAVVARIRVLIQQMLLDAVLLYNMVSSLSQKHQTVKLNQEGCEVFREYYPRKEDASILLECIWQTDNYMLVERTRKSETADQEKDQVDLSISAPKILYENIEVLLGVDESGTIAAEHPSVVEPMNVEENHSNFGVNKDEKIVKEVPDTAEASPENTNSLTNSSIGTALETNNKKLVDDDDSCISRTNERNVSLEAGLSTSSTAPHRSYSSKKETRKKVAFVAVKPPPPSAAKESSFNMKGMEKNGEGKEEDPFFHLLTGGNKSLL